MDAERWQRLSPLLDTLFELEPEARALRLRELRAQDSALTEELEALIALEDEREDFLTQPLVAPLGGVRTGSEIGPYRLERMLGEGGMGHVWLASRADGLYQRRVALKLLRPGLADTTLRLRFTRERQILARLAHPNIARLLDAGISADNLPYLALEYVDGEPITDYCREQHTPLETRLGMFRQICDAVSHAHANLIVHRDLKPSNILVTPTGEVRLLDFGIAKLLDTQTPAPERTGTGVRAFTLHYAAPEQIRGEPVSTKTDVYSLGVVLYELLTGQKPYRLARESDATWEEAILAVDPLRPSQTVLRGNEPAAPAPALRRRARMLSGDLDNIVLKALAKRPEQRYPSVEALALDLQRYQAGRPVQARAQSLGYRVGKYVGRHRWAVATGTLVALVVLGALASVAWQARQAVQEASRAQAMQDFMVELFEHASGARDGGPLDLRELLDDAVERGNRQLAQQPRDRAELLGVIARVRIGLGDYDQALALLERQALIIDATDGLPASLRLEAVTQRGRVLRLLDRTRACIALLDPALPLARREQAQLPSQATELYSQLGRCRRVNHERQVARQLFQRSLSLRQQTGGDSVGEVENRMDLAGLHADVGDLDTALLGFESARAQLRRYAGERHPLLIEIRRNLGNLQHALGNSQAAENELRGALDVALELHGASHPVTLSVRRQLGQVLVDQYRFADARVQFAEIHGRLIERLGPDHVALAESHASLGAMAWERGDYGPATSHLQQALALQRERGNPADIATALMALAQVQYADGRLHNAQALLEETRALRGRHLGAQHPLVGDTDRVLGEVDLALGRRDSGDARLRQAVRTTRAGYGPEHPNTRLSELALAYRTGLQELDAATGNLASGSGTMRGNPVSADDTGSTRGRPAPTGDTGRQGADAIARLDSLSQLPGDGPAQREIRWRAQAYAAHLRCQGGGRAQAAQSLRALAAALAREQPDSGVIRREVNGIAVACESAD